MGDTGGKVYGSVQAFAVDAIGCIEDFAMPRSLERANSFVSKEAAEALALLDMRVFNMDRHSGNLLLLRRETPHELGPIDHGCCLPPWWSLGEAIFDAWIEWPQLQSEPLEKSRDIAETAYNKLELTCDTLKGIGLEPEAIICLRLCTLLVYIGVKELGLPLGLIAVQMLRNYDCIEELTWLQAQVQQCAEAAGCPCRAEANKRGDKELVVDDDGQSLNVDKFLAELATAFRISLRQACSQDAVAEEAPKGTRY